MKEKIVKLKNEERNDIGYIRRILAYGIDWYVGGVIASLPLIIIYMMINKEATYIPQNLAIFEYPLNIVAGSLSFLTAFIYYVVVPMCIFKGQTLGKKIVKIKIVNTDFTDATYKQILIRQGIMILLIEGSVFTASNMLHQVLTLTTGLNIISLYAYLGLGITILSGVLVILLQSKRALHDVVTNTKVVFIQSDKYVLHTKRTAKKQRKQMKLTHAR